MTETKNPGVPMPGKSLRELRARAHALKPVVRISGHGASESVLREIDRSLEAHELIKVHAAVDGRSEREALLAAICEALTASPVQIIGKMLVVFRPRREEPTPATKSRKSAPARSAGKAQSTRTRAATSAKPRASGTRSGRPPARKRAGIR